MHLIWDISLSENLRDLREKDEKFPADSADQRRNLDKYN